MFNFSQYKALTVFKVVESLIELPSDRISCYAAPFPHLCLYVDFEV